MTPTQIKIVVYGGAVLLAWWLSRKASAATPRVSKSLDVDVNVLSPTFGLTDDEIAAQKAADAANPAVDPRMRELIRVSNIAIAQDDAMLDSEQ